MPADKVLCHDNDSAATEARKRYEATGKKTSPYLSSPERESYDSWTDYERPDGTRYRVTRAQSRWGGVWAEPGPPVTTELPPA
jgi:hypothetical protein